MGCTHAHESSCTQGQPEELPGPPPRSAQQLADALLASLATPQEPQEAAPEAAAAIQRPMDLFKSIFEASDSSDTSGSEPEDAAIGSPAAKKGVQPPGPVQADEAALAPAASAATAAGPPAAGLQSVSGAVVQGPAAAETAQASRPVHMFRSRQERGAQAGAAAASSSAQPGQVSPVISDEQEPSLPDPPARVTGLQSMEGVGAQPVRGTEGQAGDAPGSGSGSSSAESEPVARRSGKERKHAGKVSKRKGKHKKKSKQKEGKHKGKQRHKHKIG